MQFLGEKIWKMHRKENIEILNLLKQKEVRIIQYENQVIIQKSFSQKTC